MTLESRGASPCLTVSCPVNVKLARPASPRPELWAVFPEPRTPNQQWTCPDPEILHQVNIGMMIAKQMPIPNRKHTGHPTCPNLIRALTSASCGFAAGRDV